MEGHNWGLLVFIDSGCNLECFCLEEEDKLEEVPKKKEFIWMDLDFLEFIRDPGMLGNMFKVLDSLVRVIFFPLMALLGQFKVSIRDGNFPLAGRSYLEELMVSMG